MKTQHAKDSSVIVIPYSCKNDVKVIKDIGLELIDEIIAKEFKNLTVPAEIVKNYKKRLQTFQANLIRNIKDHIYLSKSSDFDLKKVMNEYSEKDEKLLRENDKLLSELHGIMEKHRNNRQAFLEKIKAKIKKEFERCLQQARNENSNSDNFDVIIVDGEMKSKSIPKEKFLKTFQDGFINQIKDGVEYAGASSNHYQVTFGNKIQLFLKAGQKQNELLNMLENIDFKLSSEEKVLFG